MDEKKTGLSEKEYDAGKKICRNCFKIMGENDKFCPFCGAPGGIGFGLNLIRVVYGPLPMKLDVLRRNTQEDKEK